MFLHLEPRQRVEGGDQFHGGIEIKFLVIEDGIKESLRG